MKTGKCVVAGLLTLVLANGVLAADTGLETVPVTDGIYMIAGEGGNIGVFVGEDGTFMIDDQFAPVTDNILDAVREVSGEAPRFLVNTHYHFDHTGGNENLGEGGAIIVAHDNVRKRLSVDQVSEVLGRTFEAQPDAALPVITFDEGVTFHWNGDRVDVIHVPNGHTDGDAFVHFVGANVIHTGDLVFSAGYPFLDYEAGGSIDGMIAGARKILAMTDTETRIIPGHGPVMDREKLTDYIAMLEVSRDRVAALKNEGKSLEEVLKTDPLAGHHDDWSWGMMTGEFWTRLVYNSL